MAEIDPRSLSFTDEELEIGKTFNPYVAPPSTPPPNTTFPRRPPRQIIAEVGDEFPKLADRLGGETSDLVNANPDISRISAGAVFNVPQPAPVYDVPRFDPTSGQTYQEWLDSQSGASQPPQKEKFNIFKDVADWISGLGDGKAAWDWINWEKNKDSETGYLPPGVGVGAGIGIPQDAGIIQPTIAPQAEYADFRKALTEDIDGITSEFEKLPKNLESVK